MLDSIKNILEHKCPRCRKGKLFTHHPYNPKHFMSMPKKCECCQQPFFLEPSFYYGAMYVSYGLQVALFALVMVVFRLFYPEATFTDYVVTIATIVVLLFPVTLRLSRSIWIHIYVRHDKEISDASNEEPT